MDDGDVRTQIEQLMHEEDELWSREGGLDAAARTRLEGLRVHLDQLWDLLRQRQAKREFGADPDEARERSAEIVEGYVQ